MSILTLKNPKLTVTLSTLGAEIQSIVDENGIDRLWEGDPAIWKGRAPILFPMAGGFRNDGYQLEGQWYPMPKHGFAKLKEWEVESAGEAAATLVLRERQEGFPFRYEFRAVFTLEGSSLRVDYVVDNKDSRVFYCTMGAHEAYAAPGDIEDYELVFDKKENLDCYPLEGNLIRHETLDLGRETDVLPLSYSLLDHDALVFRNLKSTGVTLRSRKHPRQVRVDFQGNRTLMFWHAPTGKYLCIEPWNNSPDFVDAPLEIEKKPDFIRLAPGQRETRSHTITFS